MKREEDYKNEIIATDADQKNIFQNLAIAFCIGGILSFISEYIPFIQGENGDLKSGVLRGGVLISLGIIIYTLQKIPQKTTKEKLTIIVLVFSIPLVALQFINYASLTVWVFPLVIMMSSLIFSKRTLLICSAVMAILTQRLMWTLKPELMVTIDKYDYIARIGMFIITFLVGFYLNRIYVAKIKENKEQLAFQKINSEVSLEFVNVNQENIDEKINRLLEGIGLFFQIDRAYLFLIDHKKKTMTYTHEWCHEGINPEVGTIEDIPLSVFPWWIDQLQINKLVYIEDVDLMPDEASEEQNQLVRQKVKSLISVPIEGAEEIHGFIGIDSVVSHKKWPGEHINKLNILSNLISNGLEKVKNEKQIEFMAYYDGLTQLPNRFLFTKRMNQAMNLAERNGHFIAIIFIDLDNFKLVNDTIGHKGGDALLQKLAGKLSGALRKADTVARFGGDEFMIMLNEIKDNNDIFRIADKLMDLFSKGFTIQGQNFLVTCSAGIAIYPADGEDAETLIKNADTAMYQAKDKGKNQYVLFRADGKEEAR